MAPPKWLVKYWNENPSWIKRFQQTSAEANMILCGIKYNEEDAIWTKASVAEFQIDMEKIAEKFTKSTILYRGTSVPSPTMHPLCYEMNICQYMSTTKSRMIAEEFKWKKDGFIHVFHCQPGVKFYDVAKDPGNNPVAREKEVIIYPGQKLTMLSLNGHLVVWKVTPK